MNEAAYSLKDAGKGWPVADDASRALYERARLVEAGGAQGEGRGYRPYPLYIDRAQGAEIVDVDGNEYLDCHNGFASVLLGHGHPRVRNAVVEAATTRGLGFSAAHELEVELAEKVCELVPSAEMVALSCTGSEATYHALRLARAITGRNKILKFEGAYHGWHDAVAWSTHVVSEAEAGPPSSPTPIPASAGIAQGAAEAIVICEYNDVAGFERAVGQHKDDLAAVIVEPIAINGGHIEPTPEFLRALRDLTEAHGILLIFDEIITGFRIALGGAQELYSADPDLTTLGKGFGNGLPISALVGKERYMSRLATSGDVLFSGTQCGNVVNVSAALAVLDVLSSSESIYDQFSKLGARLAKGLRAAVEETGVPVQVVQHGSIWGLHFAAKPVKRFRELAAEGELKYARWPVTFRRWMLEQGIYIQPAFMVRAYLSAAYTSEDVDRIVTAARKFFVEHQGELQSEVGR